MVKNTDPPQQILRFQGSSPQFYNSDDLGLVTACLGSPQASKQAEGQAGIL